MNTLSQAAPDLLGLTAQIVGSYIARTAISSAGLPDLIVSTHGALEALARSAPAIAEPVALPVPAVPIKKSITDEHLISLIDGKPYRSLRRHLSTHGFTPDTYRSAYGLPATYPMTAPAYSRARSDLAKQTGLGQQRKKQLAPRGTNTKTSTAKARAAA